MKKSIAVIVIGGICLLSGCEDQLPENDLVNNGQAFEMKQAEDDVQAGNFPMMNKEKFIPLTELKENVRELLGDNYWPEVDLTKEELAQRIGITEEMYVDFLAEKQVLDAHIDTMIIVQAKEAYVGAVEQALENYRSAIIEENRDHPQNLGKAKASRMETIDNYVCFVLLGADTTAIAEQGEEQLIDYCQEENERALYVLEQDILEHLRD
ncbi:MAG: DUF4358 domain-containing protein [Lachnospiraceae bacterium]|nr:DUF4358 domain-containing protein [Lachnospiraceae bacterium]